MATMRIAIPAALCCMGLAMVAAAADAPANRPTATAVSEVAAGEVTATGTASASGNPSDPQARLMAQRGARVVAMRNLAAKLLGEELKVDEAGSGRQAFDVLLKGARETSNKPVGADAFEVTLAIQVRQLGRNLADIWQDNLALGKERDTLRDDLDRIKASQDRSQFVLDASQQQLNAAVAANKELADDNARLTSLINQSEAKLKAANARLAELEKGK